MKKNNKCVVCGNSNILTVLNLGKSPLANNLIPFKDINKKLRHGVTTFSKFKGLFS
jgi:hypothetical protein